MSNGQFKRENRYLVLKRTDIERMSSPQKASLLFHADEVARLRSEAGKSPLSCVVVEADWPEYETVWKMIEARVSGQSAAGLETVIASDHPDFVGGWKWSDCELRWINARLSADVAKRDARIVELESRLQSLARSVITDQTYDETRNMFHAAVLDLAAISEALDCDPDDGGAVPIIEAIEELKETIAAQSAALAKARDALVLAADTYNANWWQGMPIIEPDMDEALAAIGALGQADRVHPWRTYPDRASGDRRETERRCEMTFDDWWKKHYSATGAWYAEKLAAKNAWNAAQAAEREAWREALAPIFRERMGVEQVLEGVQHVIQWRCKK